MPFRTSQAPASPTTGEAPYDSGFERDCVTARESLAAFVNISSCVQLEPWQQLLCARLDQLSPDFGLTDGGPSATGQRLLIHGPPQFGKSLIISQRLPCWILGHQPLARIRLACYNQTHATRFSKVNLSIMRSPLYERIFPDGGVRVPAICLSDEWSTEARALQLDAQPSFAALGIGCGFTGLGADLLVVDDPYKNREEAFSSLIRANIWGWWTDVVLPRLNPATNVVVMFHRWNEDDLAGRLIAEGGWETMRFAAIGDGDSDDPMARKPGEPLSSRYPLSYLRGIEKRQGSSSFLALYQGRPVPAGGSLFRSDWFLDRYTELSLLSEVWTCWDTAIKAGEDNDETACVTFGLGQDGNLYVLRARHGRWEAPEVATLLCEQAALFQRRYGERYRGDYVEDKVSGTTLMQYIRRTNPDLAVIPIRVEADKTARAHGVTPLCETGRVRFPDPERYPGTMTWSEELLAQIKSFPAGKHDDMVDAFVYGLKRFLGNLGRKGMRRGLAGGYK